MLYFQKICNRIKSPDEVDCSTFVHDPWGKIDDESETSAIIPRIPRRPGCCTFKKICNRIKVRMKWTAVRLFMILGEKSTMKAKRRQSYREIPEDRGAVLSKNLQQNKSPDEVDCSTFVHDPCGKKIDDESETSAIIPRNPRRPGCCTFKKSATE